MGCLFEVINEMRTKAPPRLSGAANKTKFPMHHHHSLWQDMPTPPKQCGPSPIALFTVHLTYSTTAKKKSHCRARRAPLPNLVPFVNWEYLTPTDTRKPTFKQ
jgi:hypothetical protein